jgi:diguanylate cyclase (GGDEF)-like protein/PAS domain S-box-containing protein
VGAELALTLALVVFVSTVLLAGVQYWLAQEAAEQHFKDNAAAHLQRVLHLLDKFRETEPDAAKALRRAQRHPTVKPLTDRGFHLFGLDNAGRVVVLPRDQKAPLPPSEMLRHLANTAWGLVSFRQNDLPVIVAYGQVPGGELIVGVVALRPMPLGPLGLSLRTFSVLAAAVVAILAALVAVLWGHFFLSKPLRRLTAEAERAAAGDLTPPEPLRRRDELGRLSLALNHLTEAARNMVERARDEQARFQRLFNDTKDGVFIAGPNGLLSDVNPALVEMFGFQRREQMLGKDPIEEFFAEPEEAQLYLDSLWAQGYVQDFPATMRRSDGSEFEVLITSTSAGQKKARFGIVRDVTQMRAGQRALRESEARYRRLVDNAPDIIYRWSFVDNRFDYISSAAREITGYSPRQLMEGEVLVSKVVHPEHRQRVRRHWGRLLRSDGPVVSEQEFMIIDAAGRTRWLREKSLLVRDEMGRPMHLEGIATEITERKVLEQELKRGRQMVESTLQGLPAAVMVIDRDHKVVHWNRAMESLTGMKASEVVGSDRQWQPFYLEPRPLLADLVLEGDLQQVMRRYAGLGLKRSQLIEDGLEGEGFFPTLEPKGRHVYFLAAPIRDQNGQVVHAVETLVDLSDKRRLERELRKLSVTDSLTGLYNQRFFYATLEREIKAAQRYGHPLSLLMADIDFFKAYNDRFGHLEGDRALSRFAGILTGCVRAMDLCCRYGGEEFVVLLPHAAMSEALGVAERVRQGTARVSFAPQGAPAGERTSLTVSLGAATLGPGGGGKDLVRRADGALYAAKQAGRNMVAADLHERGIRILPRGETSLRPKDA